MRDQGKLRVVLVDDHAIVRQGDAADAEDMARQPDTSGGEQLTCDGTRGDARGRFTCAGTLEHVANVVASKLH